MRDDGPLAGCRRSLLGFVVAGRWRAGAGGAPVAIRGGGVSESVAKAPRGGIGGEKKRGISTILFRRFGAIGAFATDLDNPRRQVLRRRSAICRTATMTNTPAVGRGPRERAPRASTSLNPRARTSSRRARGLSDDLGGYPTISRTAAPGAASPRTPRRAFRTRERRSDRRGPAERKWSAQESTAMSPLNNLPGEPHWPPGSRADRIRFNRARRSGRSSTAVTTRISMSVDQ